MGKEVHAEKSVPNIPIISFDVDGHRTDMYLSRGTFVVALIDNRAEESALRENDNEAETVDIALRLGGIARDGSVQYYDLVFRTPAYNTPDDQSNVNLVGWEIPALVRGHAGKLQKWMWCVVRNARHVMF